MRELLTGEREVFGMRFAYYLLAENLNGRDAYGVRICGPAEEITVRDLSGSPQTIQTLTKRLMDGLVTPVTLEDIVEDWLAEAGA